MERLGQERAAGGDLDRKRGQPDPGDAQKAAKPGDWREIEAKPPRAHENADLPRRDR